MNDNEFFLRQQDAVERMREMNSRAVGKNSGGHTGSSMPPVPPFVRIPQQENSYSASRQRPAPKHQKPEPYENEHFGDFLPQNKQRRQSTNHHPQEHGTQGLNPAHTPGKKTEDTEEKSSSFLAGLNLPFLDIFKKDNDITLIIGLLLILISEKADKKLLFALIYILM